MGAWFSLEAAAASRVAYGLVWLAIHAPFLHAVVGFRWRALARVWLQSALVTGMAVLPVWLSYLWIAPAATASFGQVVLAAGVGVLLWLASLRQIRHPAYAEVHHFAEAALSLLRVELPLHLRPHDNRASFHALAAAGTRRRAGVDRMPLYAAVAGLLLAGVAPPEADLPVADAQQAEPVAAAAAEAAETPVIDVIGMEIERYRRMTVPVTIMGEGPFRFMVDTGAQATVLSRDLADRLQLHDRSAATLIAMASTRQVETAMIPDFGLGDRRFVIRTAPLVEGRNIGGAEGILGLDALQGQRVLIDFTLGELHVADAEENMRVSGYDIVVRAREQLGQLIIHSAELDGIGVDVIIDTGAQGSIGNMALERRLNRRRTLDPAVMTDVNGIAITGATRVANRLALGRAFVNNVVISFADSPTFAGLGLNDRPALILGMSELRLFDRVAIDFATRRVLFDLPGDVPLDSAFRFNRQASRLQ
jgi:predicted aspartyl protease